MKKNAFIGILCVLIAMYVGLAIWLTTEKRLADNERDYAYQRASIAMVERDNAKNLAEQYKQQYQESLLEIANLKAENEELTKRFEEASFALDEVVEETGWTSLGTFRITFYCPCQLCCGKYASGYTATGTEATEGRTIAVDPKVIPLGSKVRINGHVYVAEDTGVRGHTIDIFVNSHEEALRLGTYKTMVEKAL